MPSSLPTEKTLKEVVASQKKSLYKKREKGMASVKMKAFLITLSLNVVTIRGCAGLPGMVFLLL